MNIIRSIMDDLNAILVRIETEVGMHPNQGTAAANVKAAVTSLAQHPQASVTPSGIVSPGKETPAQAASADTTNAGLTDNDPSVKSGDAGTVDETATPAA